MKKIIAAVIILMAAGSALGADLAAKEREAMIIRAEINNNANDDPFEKEALLRKIIDNCKGTEEAEAAYWDLASLYLDGFPEEMRKEAAEMLELCLRAFPDTNRAVLVKCRLVDLYDAKDKRRAELVKQLRSEGGLPAVVKNSLN